jgi:hypothetical protein
VRRSNFLFLEDKELDKNIYRIMPFEYLENMFVKNENVLVRPMLWDDPFEHFILKSRIETEAGVTIEYPFHNDMYAQCWSFENKSDALWRIYTKNKDGIRIRTTIRKLANSLSSAVGGSADLMAYIGKVKYLPNGKMIEFARSIFDQEGLDVDDIFKTLLFKRPAFKHEKEVRLMFQVYGDDRPDTIPYQIYPHGLIDQIMINPLLTKKEADEMKVKIQYATGYQGSILRSMMYTPPKKLVLQVGKRA